MLHRVVAGPTGSMVELAEAAEYLSVEADASGLPSRLEAATARIDGPDSLTGRSFRPRTFEARIPFWAAPGWLEVPGGEIASVESVVYGANDTVVPVGDVQTLAGSRGRGWLQLPPCPTTYAPGSPVTVRWTAGGPGPYPDQVKLLVLAVLHDYDTVRGGLIDEQVHRNPAFSGLLAAWDIRRDWTDEDELVANPEDWRWA